MSDITVPLSLPALVASGFVVSLATVAVPGPITLVATHLALSRHLSSAIWFLIGVTTLDVTLFTALASGAGPLLRTFGALPMVEIIGGIALLWGGISSLRAVPTHRNPRVSINNVEERKAFGSFLLGLLVAAGNPHYWIWWVPSWGASRLGTPLCFGR
jgi:threonine/homoserine/homoserine lactone efflux protein